MLWEELVKLALLGTDRSSLSQATKTALQAYGIDTSKEITEVVLEGAAIQAPLQKAGFQPKEFTGTLLEKSPVEALASCSQKSVAHLSLILGNRYPYALDEFVQTMADFNKCLPFQLLPDLLEKCVKDEVLWQKLQPTIGNRGKWLIALNPAWQKLSVTISQEKWEVGTKAERINLLRTLRKQNPEAGRKLLLSTWKEDGLNEKIAFLKCLAIGLSDVDEPFLEECLDFSRKEIRSNAAMLLSNLPNSQLQKRIFGRIQIAVFLGKENGIEKPIIVLPDPKDKTFIRDGINPKKKWKKGGETTGMLYQMISILPPFQWEKYLQRTPEQVLRLFTKSEWSMMLIEGVTNATALHDAEDWKEAILRFWLDNFANRHWTHLDVSPILDNLPNAVFNEVIFQKLKAIKFLPDEHSPLIQLLQKDKYVWENRLTNIVMSQLKEWIKNNASYSWSGYQYRNMLKQAAYTVSPKLEKSLSQIWLGDSYNWAGWEKDLQQFLTVLSFRHEMIAELEK